MPLLLSMTTMGKLRIIIICETQNLRVGGEILNPQPRLPSGHLLLNVRDTNADATTEEECAAPGS